MTVKSKQNRNKNIFVAKYNFLNKHNFINKYKKELDAFGTPMQSFFF